MEIKRGFMTDSAPLPTVTSDPALPEGVNPAVIAADLQEDGVSATPELEAPLKECVEQARSQGMDVKIVYYPGSDRDFTAPRNLAELLHPHVGGTILVMNDRQVGSVSSVYPRFAIERAENNVDRVVGAHDLYAPQQVVRADTYIRDVAGSGLDWAPLSGGIAMTAVLTIAAVAVVMKRKLKRLPAANEDNT